MSLREKIDAEIEKRLKTKNIYVANAGPRTRLSEVEKALIEMQKAREAFENEQKKVIPFDPYYKENKQVQRENEIYEEQKKEQVAVNEMPSFEDIPVAELDLPIMKDVRPVLNQFNADDVKQVTIEDYNFNNSVKYIKGDSPLSELVQYYECDSIKGEKSTPVLEERCNCILNIVAGTHGLSVLLEGKSRSGKSLIMEKGLKLFPDYTELSSCSEKAIVDIIEEINNSGILVIPEFQENVANNDYVKEAVKHLAEGKDWVYKRSGDSYVLKGSTKVFSTGADENKKIQKMDVEVLSRFIRLKTRDESEKDFAICEYQDKKAAGLINVSEFTNDRFDKLKNHINSVINDDSDFENPFAVEFGKEYLPVTQKSVHYRTMYYSLINAFSKFEKPNRVVKPGKILVNLQDVYLAHAAYNPTYIEMLTHLSEHSYKALTKDTTNVLYEKQTQRYNEDMDELKIKSEKEIDWQELWKKGYEIMEKTNPQLLNEWVNSQVSDDGKIYVYDPIKQSDIFLCDASLSYKNDT